MHLIRVCLPLSPLLLVLASCAPRPVAPPPADPSDHDAPEQPAAPPEGEAASFAARLIDVDPAVRAAARDHRFAVLDREQPGDRVRVYTLVNVIDEQATLHLQTTDWNADAFETLPIEATLRIGRFGEPGEERRFLSDLASHARRLAQRRR